MIFNCRRDLILYCLDEAKPGLALEFGVGKGDTLQVIASARPGMTYGFDSFEGLPEDWRPDFSKGGFKCNPPQVDGAELVTGFFEETLPLFVENNKNEIGFVHIDCDLGSSTRTVLKNLAGLLDKGAVILFDELIGYDGWQHHEHAALLEWVAEFQVKLQPVGSLAKGERPFMGEQAAYKIL